MSKVSLVVPHIHFGERSQRASASTLAVGPAEYRLTLSNRPSSTSCFPSALNASFTNLGEYIDAAIISFRPINRTRRFSPACSLASNVANLELLVTHLVFPRTNPCSSPLPVDDKRQ